MRYKILKKNIAPVFLTGSILLHTPLQGQQTYTKVQKDSLISHRWDFLKRDYFLISPKVYDVINAHFPEEIDAVINVAVDKLRHRRWSEADEWFEIVLRVDPDNLQAHYGLGITKREIGVSRPIILRQLNWRSSEKHFRRIVALDSTFQDVLYQWAVLERYRKNYTKAVELAHRQLAIRRDLPNVEFGTIRAYDYLISHTSFREAEAWLRSRRTKYDSYALGELYRRKGLLDEADSLFQRILTEPGGVTIQPVLLSLVRLYVQRDEPQKVHDTYWRAVEEITSRVGSMFLLEDLMTIVNDAEYSLLKGNLSLPLLRRTLQVFWLRRDPLPAAPYNSRLIEHYRRMIFAEENYRYDGFRHRLFKEDKMNMLQFPPWYYENYKFEDRGMIYIRFGKPDETAYAVDLNLPVNLSWLYYRRGQMPKMIFHFGVSDGAPPGYWTLSPGFLQPEINETMVNWDDSINRLQVAYEGEKNQLFLEMALERARMVNQGFQTDRHTWPEETKTLEMAHLAARFRHSEKEDLLQLSYAIPISSLLDEIADEDSITFEASAAVIDTHFTPLFKDVRTFTVRDDADPHVWKGLFIDEFEFPVALEPHNIAIHARIPERDVLNGWKYVYRLNGEDRDRLACSSLKLAFHISQKAGMEGRDRSALNIVPNPTKRFENQEPLFAYYEIYNLMYDPQSLTNYTLDFTLRQIRRRKNIFQKIAGIFSGRGYQVTIRTDLAGNSRTVADYIEFDISAAKPGTYELKLTVRDNVTREESFTTADLEIIE